MRRVAIACCLMLLVMAGVALAAPVPAGEKDTFEPEWHLDLSGMRAIVPEVEPNDACTAPQAVNCGDVVDPAAINVAAEYDYYSFYVTAGTPITVSTDLATGCTTSIDTYIYLYNTSCTQVAYDDDSGPGAYSLISNYTALETGYYVLGVRHYSASGTGCYKAIISCTPPATGACCRAGGVCEILTASACATALGTYMGDNTSCTPNPCPQPPVNDRCEGALPLDRCSNGVIDGTMASAVNDYTPGSGGCTGYNEAGPDVTYVLNLQAGDILTVVYDTPAYDGAIYLITDCANAATTCVIGEDDPEPETFTYTVLTAGTYYLIADAYSSTASGTFTLTWSVACPPPVGACCYADGTCLLLSEAECGAELSGTWMGPGTSCDPNPCVQPEPQACCFVDFGTCVLLFEADCLAQGGLYFGGPCDPNPCPAAVGACCYPDGSCLMQAATECAGQWLGPLSLCDPNPCPQPLGACCFPDGSCQVTLQVDCQTGAWLMLLPCDPNPCPMPVGACCYPDGSCLASLQADCPTGDWRIFEPCDPNPCPQPPPVGACCFEDGTCQELTAADCAAAQGVWQNEGSSCDPNPCEPVPVERTSWGQIKSQYR